jgi:NAD-dependent SIR2 family protein deacetylase
MLAKDLLCKNGELAHKVRSVRDLIRHIGTREENSANYCFLLGAGCSVTSGVKSASTLIDQWVLELYERFQGREATNATEAKSFFEKQHANWYNPLNPYSSLFEKKYDLPNQRRRFIEHEVDGKLPSIGYAYLASLVDENFINTVFTTNFDDLLNEAFYQLSNTRPIMCAHDSSIKSVSVTSKRPKIIKLHGDYLYEDIKSSLRETESLEQNIRDKLIEFCKDFGLVVAGYAGNDRSVMDVLEFLTKQDTHLKNGIYWCLREGDEVSHTLRNLLWRDKVYPIIIDGFDELFATCHKELTSSSLDLEKRISNSKRERTIDKILKDSFGLSDNVIIKEQISLLQNDKDKSDISHFLSEINNNSENSKDIVDADLKKLLEIDSLARKGSLLEAIELCKKHISKETENDKKENYILKMIRIFEKSGDNKEALDWANQLILLDPGNVKFRLLRAECSQNPKEQYEYVLDLLNDRNFKTNYQVLNHLSKTGFEYLENSEKPNVINIDDIIDFTETSLRLEPSLTNNAWSRNLSLLHFKKNATEKESERSSINKAISKLIEQAEICNPIHITTLELLIGESIHKNDSDSLFKIFDDVIELRKNVSNGNKFNLDKVTTRILEGLQDIDDTDIDIFRKLSRQFYENVISDKEIKNNSQLLLCKSFYYLDTKSDFDTSRSYFIEAMSSSDIVLNLSKASDLLDVFEDYDVGDMLKRIEQKKNRLFAPYYSNIKHLLLVKKGEFGLALKALDDGYAKGMNLGLYLARASFVMLLKENYSEIIRLRKKYMNYVNANSEHLEAFKINYQMAAYKLNSKDFSQIELRNIAGKSKTSDVKICCFSLLNNEKQAKVLIKEQINRHNSKIYKYRSWPVIKDDYLIGY